MESDFTKLPLTIEELLQQSDWNFLLSLINLNHYKI